MGKNTKGGSNKSNPDSQSRLSSLTGSNSTANTSSGDSGDRVVIVKAEGGGDEPEFQGTPAMEADEALAAQQEFMNELRSAVETSRSVYESNVTTLSSAVDNLEDSILLSAVADWMNDHISNLNGDEGYESCLSDIDWWISTYGG